jgi:hypothetical protein
MDYKLVTQLREDIFVGADSNELIRRDRDLDALKVLPKDKLKHQLIRVVMSLTYEHGVGEIYNHIENGTPVYERPLKDMTIEELQPLAFSLIKIKLGKQGESILKNVGLEELLIMYINEYGDVGHDIKYLEGFEDGH